MDDKVNLAEAQAQFDEPFQPRIIGTMNDYKLMVAKTKGEFVWHTHPETDDFFLVLRRSARYELPSCDRDVLLRDERAGRGCGGCSRPSGRRDHAGGSCPQRASGSARARTARR